jgi:4-hydroxy-tetrahydrodipicolinate synthase
LSTLGKQEDPMELHGLISAMVTPFEAGEAGAVDEVRLRSIVEETIAGGVHALVPNGSTGEFPTQTHDERRRVVEITLDQAAGRVPVVPHIGAMTAADAIRLGRHAEEHGAAGVMVVSPYYEPLDLDETKDYYRRVAGALSLPVMIYNLPVATGVNLPPREVAALAREVDTIRYVKDTSGDFNQGCELIHEHGDVIKTFVGLDTLYFAALVEGGAGSVNGAANFIAPELAAVYDAARAGDLETAGKVWASVYPVMKFLISGGYVAGVKGAMDVIGRSAGDPRLPIHPMSGERRAEFSRIWQTLQSG